MATFSNNQTPPGTNGPEKPRSQTRKVLRYMFNPEFGRSAAGIGQTFQMFVQMLALLFVSNGTLEKNHPFFAPGAKYTIGDLFRETAARIEWQNKLKLPQTIFFCAVWGLLTSAILYLVTFVLLFVAAPHAAHAADAPAAANATTDSMFKVADDDLVIQFIRNMVMGEPLKAMGENPKGLQATGAVQMGLRAMLAFYSKFILIIASFMLLYQIIMLIAKSAWSGRPLEGANQIWGPLRLVIAIGLLVPLGSNLNSGQHIVLKIAEMGSALATNGWQLFVSNMQSGRGFVAGDNSSIRSAYTLAAMTYACQFDVNYNLMSLYKEDFVAAGVDFSSANKNGITDGQLANLPFNVRKRWIAQKEFDADDGVKGYSLGTNRASSECGTIYIPVKKSAQAANDDGLTDPNTAGVATSIRNAAVDAGATLMADAKETAKLIVSSTRNHNGDCGSDGQCSQDEESAVAKNITDKIKADVNKYTATLAEKTKTAFASQQPGAPTKYQSWIMAGAYFYQISAYQRGIYTAMQTKPEAKPGQLFFENDPTEVSTYSPTAMTSMSTPTTNNEVSGEKFRKLKSQYAQYFTAAFEAPADTASSDADHVLNAKSSEEAYNKTKSTLQGAFKINKDTFIKNFSGDVSAPYESMLQMGNFLYTTSGYVILGSIVAQTASAFVENIPVLGGVGKGVQVIAGYVMTIGIYMFTLGVLLAFLLPLLPAIKFLMDGVSWLLAVFEALIGMPLFALAHLSPGGDGLLDPARHGYSMLLHIMIKPILMVFGLIVAILLISIALFGLNAIFLPTFDAAWGTDDVSFVTALVLLGIWAFNVYHIANACFKFVDHLPNATIQWFGQKGHSGLELEGSVNPLAAQNMIGNATKGVASFSGATAGAVGKSGAAGFNAGRDAVLGKTRGKLEEEAEKKKKNERFLSANDLKDRKQDEQKEADQEALQRARDPNISADEQRFRVGYNNGERQHRENIDATMSYHPYFRGRGGRDDQPPPAVDGGPPKPPPRNPNDGGGPPPHGAPSGGGTPQLGAGSGLSLTPPSLNNNSVAGSISASSPDSAVKSRQNSGGDMANAVSGALSAAGGSLNNRTGSAATIGAAATGAATGAAAGAAAGNVAGSTASRVANALGGLSMNNRPGQGGQAGQGRGAQTGQGAQGRNATGAQVSGSFTQPSGGDMSGVQFSRTPTAGPSTQGTGEGILSGRSGSGVVSSSINFGNAGDMGAGNGAEAPSSGIVGRDGANLDVGTPVQWTNNGADQFAEPQPISHFEEKDGQTFAFVEGSTSGMPVNELTPVADSASPQSSFSYTQPESGLTNSASPAGFSGGADEAPEMTMRAAAPEAAAAVEATESAAPAPEATAPVAPAAPQFAAPQAPAETPPAPMGGQAEPTLRRGGSEDVAPTPNITRGNGDVGRPKADPKTLSDSIGKDPKDPKSKT